MFIDDRITSILTFKICKLTSLEYFLLPKRSVLVTVVSAPFKILQKQSSRGVLRRRFPENMQQIYRRTPIPKCDFKKVAKQQLFLKNIFHLRFLLRFSILLVAFSTGTQVNQLLDKIVLCNYCSWFIELKDEGSS